MFTDFLTGFALLLDWSVLVANIIGIVIGTIVGAIPGLGPVIAIAVLIPVTFVLPTVPAIMLLLGVYQAGIYGGSISAVLFNIPGVPAAAATVYDGFPMAQRGEGSRALKIALYSSTFGNIFSCLVLLLVAAPLASIALRFGPPELAALLLLALTVIAGVSGGSMLKGLLTGLLGLLFSTVGLDPIWGTFRFTMEIPELENGLALVPVLIGLFAISELLIQVGKPDPALLMKSSQQSQESAKELAAKNHVSLLELWKMKGVMFYSALIGIGFGILPGIGSTTPAFMSYAFAKQKSKHPEKFGTGIAEGVAAPETANNAVTGGALIPLLSLGIPGDAVTAIILGALMLQGITPGPFVFRDNGVEVYAFLIGLILSTVPTLIVGRIFLRYAVKVLTLKRSLIFSTVLIMCVVGSFSVNNSVADIAIMCVFGFIGYALRIYNFPLPPLLIGFVIGKGFEEALRQSLLVSQGSVMIFLQKPIAAVFVVLSAIILLWSMWSAYKTSKSR
ncbi:MAG: tripartite tricarboxylate transporter permease [Desulfuromonadales bacterium]|nr:tripartite tricarboxylate transporter permease [Desulfuromonadales bacterium]MBN2792032.1 tripartite tricarboxylate transporter permease [Desulfuromonadales bacterium]